MKKLAYTSLIEMKKTYQVLIGVGVAVVAVAKVVTLIIVNKKKKPIFAGSENKDQGIDIFPDSDKGR